MLSSTNAGPQGSVRHHTSQGFTYGIPAAFSRTHFIGLMRSAGSADVGPDVPTRKPRRDKFRREAHDTRYDSVPVGLRHRSWCWSKRLVFRLRKLGRVAKRLAAGAGHAVAAGYLAVRYIREKATSSEGPTPGGLRLMSSGTRGMATSNLGMSSHGTLVTGGDRRLSGYADWRFDPSEQQVADLEAEIKASMKHYQEDVHRYRGGWKLFGVQVTRDPPAGYTLGVRPDRFGLRRAVPPEPEVRPVPSEQVLPEREFQCTCDGVRVSVTEPARLDFVPNLAPWAMKLRMAASTLLGVVGVRTVPISPMGLPEQSCLLHYPGSSSENEV